MTHPYTKLADELRAAAYKAPDRATSRAMFEAAHIIRSAASLDITGFMAMHDAAAEARRVLVSGGNVPQAEADRSRLSRAALESALRLVLAQRVPPGCVVVPVERLTVEEIKTLRQQVRNDPRCQDEHWFVLMARAIEDRYLAAALTDQSQKKESP